MGRPQADHSVLFLNFRLILIPLLLHLFQFRPEIPLEGIGSLAEQHIPLAGRATAVHITVTDSFPHT